MLTPARLAPLAVLFCSVMVFVSNTPLASVAEKVRACLSFPYFMAENVNEVELEMPKASRALIVVPVDVGAAVVKVVPATPNPVFSVVENSCPVLVAPDPKPRLARPVLPLVALVIIEAAVPVATEVRVSFRVAVSQPAVTLPASPLVGSTEAAMAFCTAVRNPADVV